MINGLGVLGWGVGGIEAEAAMLGEPISMLVPQVVGFAHGRAPGGRDRDRSRPDGYEILRAAGVVGKFVEYRTRPRDAALRDRATIGNMSPEYGATCGFFPTTTTSRYLRLTGRPEERVALVEAYCKENALWHDPDEPATYSQVIELDLSTVEPSLAGPRRPQDRAAERGEEAFLAALPTFGVDYGTAHDEAIAETFPASDLPSTDGAAPHLEGRPRRARACAGGARRGQRGDLHARRRDLRARSRLGRHRRDHVVHEHVQPGRPGRRRAARKKAVERELQREAVGEVEPRARLEGGHAVLRQGGAHAVPRGARHTVGYGCTTCIGNSGPLPEPISAAVAEGDLVVCAVLSGNRNFEARIHGEVKANYPRHPRSSSRTRSPGAWTSISRPSRSGRARRGGRSSRTFWPSPQEVAETVAGSIGQGMFRETYADVYTGEETWRLAGARG